jgi:hypothetical protein
MTTEKQRNAGRAGLRAQHKAARWLKDHGWADVRETHPGPYDIEGKKRGEFWLLDCKSGDAPSVEIRNLLRMLEEKRKEKRVDKVALIFVPNRPKTPPLLFTLDKMSYAGLKASITKGSKREKQAGEKAWRTQRSRHRT